MNVRKFSAAAISTMLAVLSLTPSAFAVQEQNNVSHLFNATLSLTGDCEVSNLDPVPDPGCPSVVHPPEGSIDWPTGVSTDTFGDIYVTNNNRSGGQNKLYVDVFDPSGHYIAQAVLPRSGENGNHTNVAVDSTGHLYVSSSFSTVPGPPLEPGSEELVRFDPTAYNPAAGEIEYGSPPVTISNTPSGFTGLAVDPTNDDLYARFGGSKIFEYGPPTDGVPNEIIGESGESSDLSSSGLAGANLAVDASRERLYVVDNDGEKGVVKILSDQAPFALIGRIDGSTTPAREFLDQAWRLAVAENEKTGEVFVADTAAKNVYAFSQSGEYIETMKKPAFLWDFVSIHADNSPTSPNQGYVFVPSGGSGNPGHLFAFEPKPEAVAPVVESVGVAGITETEAVLKGIVNAKGLATHYFVEYVTQAAFQESGFTTAQIAGGGELPPSSEGAGIAVPVAGLSPGTPYRYRVRAENLCAPGGCSGELQGSFRTYSTYAQAGGCSNDALRTGLSAALPDCRAYELVTPADTSGLAPYALGVSGGPQWETWPASPDGSSVGYMVLGGLIPGLGGNAAFNGTAYVSKRAAEGWRNEALGPDGTQASQSDPGGSSPDHSFFAVDTYELGTLVTSPNEHSMYVRYPDASFHLLAEGELGTANLSTPLYIAAGGSHIIFATKNENGRPAVRLLPDAPPDGTTAIYDRTPVGLKVISLLPGDITPSGEAKYLGTSSDGAVVAFSLGPIYVRINDVVTKEAAPTGSTFAGLSKSGRYLFYLDGGNVYRFDTETEMTVQVTETANAVPVNISSDGQGVYFISTKALSVEPNPFGIYPHNKDENLYYWDAGGTQFVATVSSEDVEEGEASGTGIEGLGLWIYALQAQSPAILASRTDESGSVLLFRSRENLAGFDSEGKAEIYRYDGAGATLQCVSCSPTGSAPVGSANLLSANPGTGTGHVTPVSKNSVVPNLSPDGNRAFFETPDRLVPGDNDNLLDVYEWEAFGKGSCATPGGCLFLISSGQSAYPNYLFGVSESGDDVFIRTSDRLTGEDDSEAASIYDARVGGGFPPPANQAAECLGEACQPAATPPSDPTLTSASFEGAGNVPAEAAKSHCPKGKRAVRSHGKKHCIAKKRRHKRRNHKHRRNHKGKRTQRPHNKQGNKRTKSNRRTGR